VYDLFGDWVKIVSLSPSITDTLTTLGLEDHIVGVTPFCLQWLKDKDLSNIVFVGDYLKVNVEKLKLLKPDIVFLQSHVHDKIFKDLAGLGFNVYLINLPETVVGSISEIIKISDITGKSYEGREIASKLTEELMKHTKDLVNKPINSRIKVYIEYLWPNWTYSTSGALTFINDMIWLAGGLNIFYNKITKFFKPEDNELINLKPQITLVNVEPHMKIDISKYLNNRKVMKELTKLFNTKVYLITETKEVNLAHWGPSALIKTIVKIKELISSLSQK